MSYLGNDVSLWYCTQAVGNTQLEKYSLVLRLLTATLIWEDDPPSPYLQYVIH